MRTSCLALLVLAAVMTVGCGGGDESIERAPGADPVTVVTSPPAPPAEASKPPNGGGEDPAEDEEEVERVVRAVYVGIGSRNGEEVCDLHTEEGRAQILEEAQEFDELADAPCEEIVVAFSGLYGGTLSDVQVTDIDIDGDDATATATFPDTELGDQNIELARNGDGWRVQRTTEEE